MFSLQPGIKSNELFIKFISRRELINKSHYLNILSVLAQKTINCEEFMGKTKAIKCHSARFLDCPRFQDHLTDAFNSQNMSFITKTS